MMIPLLCICAIVIGFDRKLNFLYYEKAYFKGLYLYKDKLSVVVGSAVLSARL